MKRSASEEPRRWFLQARRDIEVYYLPTRHPNGLPGDIPSDAYTEADAQMALSMAQQVLDFVEVRLNL